MSFPLNYKILTIIAHYLECSHWYVKKDIHILSEHTDHHTKFLGYFKHLIIQYSHHDVLPRNTRKEAKIHIGDVQVILFSCMQLMTLFMYYLVCMKKLIYQLQFHQLYGC